ncbi:MAG TPA: WD40 repeat domain-containing protein [Gemmataceae bacterium]|jgi:WD40 repeat protein
MLRTKTLLSLFVTLALLVLGGKPAEACGETVDAAKKERIDSLGDPLPFAAFARLGTTRFWQRVGVYCFAFSPDGKTLVSGGPDDVRVLDAVNGREIRRFPNRTDAKAMAYSTDGKILAVGGGTLNPTITWYEMPSGRLLHKTPRQPGGVSALTFSPDGKLLVSAGFNQTIRIWDVASGKERRQILGCERWIRSLALTPDSKQLVAPGEQGAIRVWGIESGKELRQWPAHDKAAYSVAFDPAGKTLASAGEDGKIVLWDFATGTKRRQLRGHVGSANRVVFSPDGKRLASLGSDETSIERPGGKSEVIFHDVPVIFLWDVATGRQLHALHRRPGSAHRIAFSPDGKLLAAADRKISFYDVSTGKKKRALPGHDDVVESIALSPDGRTLASRADDKTIRVWDLQAGKEIRQHYLSTRRIDALVLSPDGKTLVWPDEHRVCFADLATGESLPDLSARQPLGCPAVSADGKMLAVAGRDNTIYLWQLSQRRLLRQFKAPGAWVQMLAFSPNGKILAAADSLCTAYLLDAVTGKELHRLRGEVGWLTDVAFSPDGRTVVTSGSHEGVRLWDVKTSIQITKLGERRQRRCIAFSQDGRTIATVESGNQPRIRLWELATREERHHFEGHLATINCLAFAADGKTLVSGSDDTTILVWDLLRTEGTQETITKDGEALWKDLQSDDARRAFRAIRQLVRIGGPSVPLLQARLRPVPHGDARRIAQRIADLDSSEFAVREKAMRDLERMGESAETALNDVLRNRPTLEVRRRVEQLLERLGENKTTPEQFRALRSLEVLEYIGTREARELLEGLAGGEPAARLTREAEASLRRLQRIKQLRPAAEGSR